MLSRIKGKPLIVKIGGRKMLEVILDVLGIDSSIAVIALVWKGWKK